MWKAKIHTNVIDSMKLSNIGDNAAFVKRLCTECPVSEHEWYVRQS